MVDKKALRLKFSQEWEKHYNLEVLKERGFKRQRCKKCGRYFWAKEERDYCGDPACIGYQFIGNAPSKLKLGYVETWKRIEDYFVKHGHTSIEPYPTVARWRDDVYFTMASISDFQPYVVNGELEPIANPLIIPQPCIRFPDISNVGVTGRHYTNFVMIGQHAFNNDKTGLFYWKEEALEHDINYLTQAIGIPEDELIFHEDVWAGGGNFGPSMEYFAGGLELGNCVFMQYEELPDGTARELKTKVIDMGAGLSRLTWITHGTPTSYEVVLGKPVEIIKEAFGNPYVDPELFLKYSELAGGLNIDEVDDIEAEKTKIAKDLGVDKEEFFNSIEPLQAAYAIADHTLTLLFTVYDGMMPSNSGGGYNLRILARRIFAFEDQFGVRLDYAKILEAHMDHLKGLFDKYRDGVDVTAKVLEEERKKYVKTRDRAKNKVITLVKKVKAGKKIGEDELVKLYKSDGIPPEYIQEFAKKEHVHIDVPGDFYEKVREPDVVKHKTTTPKIDVASYPPTEKLYYEVDVLPEFEATVLGIEDDWVILDKTLFYPESGGQAADRGWLNDVKVTDVQKIGSVIIHKVKDPLVFEKDQKVKGKIDWQRRFRITRHHTATHLITAAARKILGKHVWQAGSYQDDEKGHIDLTHYKRISQDELNRIEAQVNEYIRQNKDILIEVIPRNVAEKEYGFTIYQGGAIPSKDIRIVKIPGVDVEACGGTHHILHKIGEIGYVKLLKRESVRDSVERLFYKAGDRAVVYVQEMEAVARRAAETFSVDMWTLPKTAKRFFTEWKEANKRAEKAENQLLDVLLKNERVVEIDFEPKSIPSVKNFAAILTPKTLIVVGDKSEEVWHKLREKGVKGGGKKPIFKGQRANITKEKVLEWISEIGNW